MRTVSFLRILPVALTLGGCTTAGLDRLSEWRADGSAATPVLLTPVSAADDPAAENPIADALALLPVEAGGVIRLRERTFVNGVRQQVVLEGGSNGENVLEISLRTSGGDQAPRGGLQIGRPSERGVRTEIVARFPDMKMHIVTRRMGNVFGDFGLAIGRHASGARCVFAWQWVDDLRTAWPGTSGLDKMGALLSMNATPASIRVRLCRQDATVDQLAAMVEALQAGRSGALKRLLRPDRRPVGEVLASAGGGTGDLIPVTGSLESAMASVLGPQQRVSVAVAPPPQPRPRPAAVAFTPPAPPRRVARALPRPKPKPAPRRAAPAAAPERAWAPAGPRYLAPVEAPVAVGSMPVGSIGAQRTGVLNAALPPQAYLGPSAQRPYAPRAFPQGTRALQ